MVLLRIIGCILVSGMSVLAGPFFAFAQPGVDTTSAGVSRGSDDATVPARAGRWIQVDPQTGQPVAPTAPRAAIAPDPRFSTSQQGLVERPDAGGGVMVDLQGRFRSAATATLGADGKPDLDCVAPGSAARDVKP